MSYKIALRVYQTNPNSFFHVVEQTCFTKGAWCEINGEMILQMDNSGTSGTLRLESHDNKENFVVVVGVHNYKRWCDIVTDLKSSTTGASLNPEYYDGKRDSQREKQLSSFNVSNATGRKISIKFVEEEGKDLMANILIG